VAAAGGGFTVRDVESWDRDGLGPLADTAETDLAGHYGTLASISCRGRPYGTTAVLLASHGFACPLLQDVLRRELRVDEIPRMDPWSADGVKRVDEIAATVASDLRGAPDEPNVKTIRAMLRNVGRANRGGEVGMAQRAFLADAVTGVMGGKLIDSETAAQALGMETAPEGQEVLPRHFEQSFSGASKQSAGPWYPIERIRELVEDDLPGLVRQIPLVEQLLRYAFLPKIGVRLKDEEIAKLAVIVAAPVIVGMEASIKWVAEANLLTEGETPEMIMTELIDREKGATEAPS
jgi:hypothetical protein